ncbi:hypothetical protein N7455_008378 [Penicillium solitum]|uniref:uncharacterized protein n=1 Tax=Penicillium solitum TaxID=60172 RepID=UPI0032C41151|nr:hypothetical protein N7455_008378 [Penicillium solitum]
MTETGTSTGRSGDDVGPARSSKVPNRRRLMTINLFLVVVFELYYGFCPNILKFLGVRGFGVESPVLFEPAVTAALEDLLHDVHRLLSGLFEMGYVTGCLLAADCYRAFVPPTTYGFVLIWSSPPLVPPRTETFPRGESRA